MRDGRGRWSNNGGWLCCRCNGCHGLLENRSGAAVHGVGHGVMDRQSRFVPLHLLLLVATSHEHQSKQGSHDENSQDDGGVQVE